MLSSFAYHRIIQHLKAAAFRAGVHVIEVNPAYTSTIGAVNYAAQLGISVHQGAAIAITLPEPCMVRSQHANRLQKRSEGHVHVTKFHR